jgi:hypothetical protein
MASEAGHWYDKGGNPAYTTIGKNGVERPTTLRDAKKLGRCLTLDEIDEVLAGKKHLHKNRGKKQTADLISHYSPVGPNPATGGVDS